MKPIVIAAMAPLFLVACDFGTGGGGGGGGGGATGDANTVFTGDVDNITYDATTDKLVIGDLPFDGVSGEYDNAAITTIPGFGVFTDPLGVETGQFRYYAVYGEGTYGSAGAVGTGDYGDFGHGGAMFVTDGTSVDLPTVTGELVYTGDYAGIRVLDQNAGNDLFLTSGDATLLVDLLDPTDSLAIIGSITNHQLHDLSGAVIGTLENIAINETGINTDGSATGTVETYDSAGDVLQSGSYQAQFAGPNGEEIIGFLVLSGDVEGVDYQVQETGVFITVD